VGDKFEAFQKGEYQAAGITSGIAGSGFNLGIIDDPMSEQDKDSKTAKDFVWEWYGSGFYTRRQPERNAIVLCMTRWATDDLAGRLIAEEKNGGDKWEVLNIPAILDHESARKVMIEAKNYNWPKQEGLSPLKVGESFSPQRWSTKELLRSKSNMRERDWNALYMGKPVDDEGAILKRNYWRLWPSKELPHCHTIFTFYDTAFEQKESGDYSACTTWGIFEFKDRDGRPANHMILLGRWKRRIDAPDLSKVVVAFCYGTKHWKRKPVPDDQTGKYADMEELVRDLVHNDPLKPVVGFEPDRVLIENKASGIWLVKELRRMKNPGVPVYPWNPPKGDAGTQLGKYARAQKAALVLEKGTVWYQKGAWCEEVIDECARCKFDGSDESDDLPDTVTMAMLYVRQTFMIEFESDIDEDEEAEAELAAKKTLYG
jgi:phage terminase large subunit-like protein